MDSTETTNYSMDPLEYIEEPPLFSAERLLFGMINEDQTKNLDKNTEGKVRFCLPVHREIKRIAANFEVDLRDSGFRITENDSRVFQRYAEHVFFGIFLSALEELIAINSSNTEKRAEARMDNLSEEGLSLEQTKFFTHRDLEFLVSSQALVSQECKTFGQIYIERFSESLRSNYTDVYKTWGSCMINARRYIVALLSDTYVNMRIDGLDIGTDVVENIDMVIVFARDKPKAK